MKKTLLSLTLCLTSIFGFSQNYTYHSADDCTFLNTSGSATYVSSIINPNTTDPTTAPNTSINVSSVLPDANNSGFFFELPVPIQPGDNLSLSLRLYATNDGGNNIGSGRYRFRLYNSNLGLASADRIQIIAGDYIGGEWVTVSYVESSVPETSNGTIAANGGYDSLLFIPSNNAAAIETIYFDDIIANIEPNTLDDDATLETGNDWLLNNSPDVLNGTIAGFSGSTIEEAQPTPSTSGNSSSTVLKITRDNDKSSTGLKLTSDYDIDYTTGNLKFRIFPECNLDTNSNVQIRLRDDGSTTDQIIYPAVSLVDNQWNEVTIDLGSITPDPVAANNLYNEFVFLVNSGDATSASNGAVFYMDAIQTPEASTLSTNDITTNINSINLYPNPVTNSFQLDSNKPIESVKLYNITGRLLKTFRAEANYDISDLATGIYLVNIKTQSTSETLRLVKK